MPVAKFQMDDGRVARFEVPDGTSPEQATKMAEDYFASQSSSLADTGLVGAAIDMAKGKGRDEGYPELPDTMMTAPTGEVIGGTAPKMSLGADDAAKLDIYMKMRAESGDPLKPGQSGFDKHGNAWVTQGGKRYYLNAPGISGQDAYDVSTAGAFMTPLARIGGLLGAGAGFMGRVGGTALGSGGGSVAQDLAAIPAGSKQGVSRERAALGAFLGGAGEAMFPAFSGAANALRGNRNFINQSTGQITAEGEAFLRMNGINPAEVSADMMRELEQRARGAANPQAAVANAEASSLPVRVPLTRGMQTLNPSDQLFENNAKAGAFGDQARQTVQGAWSNSENALRNNIDAIRNRINPAGGGDPVTASSNVQSSLRQINEAARNRVGAAYRAAEQTSAGVSGESINGIAHNLRMGTGISPAVSPRVHSLIDGFEGLAGTGQTVRAGELFQLRRDLNALSTSRDAEGAAASAAKRTLDSEINRLVEDGLIQGDDSAIEAWRQAINHARRRFSDFKAGDVIEKLVDTQQGSQTLKVAPDQAVNVLFGRGQIFGNGVAMRDLSKIRRILGADSQEWAQLREAAWVKLSEKALGGFGADSQRKLMGANFANALNKELNDRGALMHTMFSQEEINMMRQFGRVLSRVTSPVEGGKNFSNTAPALTNIVQNLIGAIFVTEGPLYRWLAMPGIRVGLNGAAAFRASGATSGATARNASRAAGIGGGLLATGATQPLQNLTSGQR